MKISNLVSHFVLCILLIIFMWVGVTYVMQNIQYSSAKQFYNSVIVKLENSDFSEGVLDQCREKAKEKGYDLMIETFDSGGETDARVILAFVYEYPVLQVKQNYTIEGYAR